MPRLHSVEYMEEIEMIKPEKEREYDIGTGRSIDSFESDDDLEEQSEEE